VTKTTSNDRELILVREFDAPKSVVYNVWTKPEHVAKWWGCDTLVNVVCETDIRVGGAYRYVNRDANGKEHPFTGIYREIVPNERLVYTQIYDVAPWSEHEALVTTIFTEELDRTTVTVHIGSTTGEPFNPMVLKGMESAIGSSIQRMSEYVKQQT